MMNVLDYVAIAASVAFGLAVALYILLATKRKWLPRICDRLTTPASMDPLYVKSITKPIGFPGLRLSRQAVYAKTPAGSALLPGLIATYLSAMMINKDAPSIAVITLAVLGMPLLWAISQRIIEREQNMIGRRQS